MIYIYVDKLNKIHHTKILLSFLRIIDEMEITYN